LYFNDEKSYEKALEKDGFKTNTSPFPVFQLQ